MARDRSPSLLDLLVAKRNECLAHVDALDRAIAALQAGIDSDLAPLGCDRRADGVSCSPQRWQRVCLVEGCGKVLQLCAAHGGHRRVLELLVRHKWEAHGVEEG